jgi:hypothetical protein
MSTPRTRVTAAITSDTAESTAAEEASGTLLAANSPRTLATAGMFAAVGTPATAASQATCQSGGLTYSLS